MNLLSFNQDYSLKFLLLIDLFPVLLLGYNKNRETWESEYISMQQTDQQQDIEHQPNKKSTQSTGNHHHLPYWAVMIVSLATGVIYALLPERLTIGPNWLLLAIETIIILPLVIARLLRHPLPHRLMRTTGFLSLGVLTTALVFGVFLMISTLHTVTHGESLLLTAASMYIFNILVFALWYWEIDGGGPRGRHLAAHQATDFMFPQQADGNTRLWVPGFVDYLFLAFTAATALSPTDTYPLTPRAKMLMMIEAILALCILAVLAGRAVNIF